MGVFFSMLFLIFFSWFLNDMERDSFSPFDELWGMENSAAVSDLDLDLDLLKSLCFHCFALWRIRLNIEFVWWYKYVKEQRFPPKKASSRTERLEQGYHKLCKQRNHNCWRTCITDTYSVFLLTISGLLHNVLTMIESVS